MSNKGGNNYGDEEVVVVARHLPSLQQLWVSRSRLGREGVAVFASSIVNLEVVGIGSNQEVMQGAGSLGRLPNLKELSACTCKLTQRTPDW